MEKQVRRLVVMRHAKAEPVAPSDMERHLTERGRADAAAAGAWLVDQGFAADVALVSTAVRTRETWQALSERAGWELEADLRVDLYSAGPEAALDVVRTTPGDVESLLVLGHNPTVAYLAQLLSDGQGDPELLARASTGFPPASVTLFELSTPWASLGFGDARLVGFHVGHS